MTEIDREKFAEIYQKFYKQLVQFAYYRVSSFYIAEEIVQESFLKTWEFLVLQKKKVRDPKNFLYKVTKNLIIDHYKKSKKNEISLTEYKQIEYYNKSSLGDVFDDKLKYDFAVKSIKKLRPRYKNILTYKFIDEKDIASICKITGLSPNSVSVSIYQGLKIIKKQAELNKVG